MPLTVVSLAYPFVPIGRDTVGGTEQALAILDQALVDDGHRSIVIGSEGSRVAGTLAETPRLADSTVPDQAMWDWAYGIHEATLARVLREEDVDVVHLHGVDFERYLGTGAAPVLATLHLPPHNYPPDVWRPHGSLRLVNCVSNYSRRQYDPFAAMAVIPYGIDLDQFRPAAGKDEFVLALGRITPEKGFHLALDAARQAGLKLILGGKVPPFADAVRYFEEEIRPRLDADRQFVGPIALAERTELLARARCVVIPSLVNETGPLVAFEALASGTPVVAFAVGALPDNVDHGRTGFLVNSVEEMARAMQQASWLDPHECRRVARARWSSERMGRDYLGLYKALAAIGRSEGALAA
jgi:glycosyltransferase involved in cell wall biosynthesis